MNSYFTSQKAGFGVRLIRGLAALALAITSLAVVFHLTGCEQTPTEVQDYHPEPILSGFIVNGEPVAEVYLERVAGLSSYYDPRDHGIVGAEIILYEVGGSDTLRFSDDPAYPGRYIPLMGDSLIPRGTALYRIEAQTPAPASELLWAETRVPGAVDGHGPLQTFLVNADSSITPVSGGDTLTRDFGTFVWVWADVDSVG